MNKNIKRNKYHVDEQTNTVTFKTRSACGTAVSKFVADVDDLDILACTTWNKTTGANNKGVLIYGSNGESILQTIGSKYVYATNGRKVFLARINQNTLNYCKTNLICNNKESNMMFGKLSRTKPSQNKSTKFLHTEYTPVHGGVYVASISTKLKGVLAKKVTRSFSVSKYSHAKERTIYAAYLFEKQFYGDDFPEEEYAHKEETFKVLDKVERAEVEDAIVEHLEKLRLARKKIDNYYQSQTLATKLASGEVIIRPDWKTDDTEESDGIPVNSEPEPELKSEYDTKDYTIKCSKKLLTDIYKKQGSNQFIHVYRRINGSRSMWSVLASLPKYRIAFTIDLSDRKYTNAKALAVYAAYLFEKLAYGDNFPNTEYNRKLDVIKTLSTEDIEFVNEMVAPKLEKVYTILKELASDKPAESNEPLIDYEIGRSKDAVFEQIKQTPLKEDALETAAVDDELFAERFKRIEIPERNKLAIQQAIAEIKQKPSLFQRIKNWFAN